MVTTADSRRWDDLHASYATARAAVKDYESSLRPKYGYSDPNWRSWITRTERAKFERLEARADRIGDKIVNLIVQISPRGEAWLSGAPAWWIRERLTWEDAIRPTDEPLSVEVPAPWGANRGLTEASLATADAGDWRDALVPGDARYVHAVVVPQMPGIVARAIAAGAEPPLEYVGVGMTGVVFCTGDTAYKVARDTKPIDHQFFEEEADWLEAAAQVPAVARHVARFHDFDPDNLVIIRDCPQADPEQSAWRYGENKLHDLHRQIERDMIPYGWTAPEFKPDSYILTTRGPVLVDASMPSRVGDELARYVEEVARNERHLWTTRPEDLAFAVRTEAGRTISQAESDRLEALIKRRWPVASGGS